MAYFLELSLRAGTFAGSHGVALARHSEEAVEKRAPRSVHRVALAREQILNLQRRLRVWHGKCEGILLTFDRSSSFLLWVFSISCSFASKSTRAVSFPRMRACLWIISDKRWRYSALISRRESTSSAAQACGRNGDNSCSSRKLPPAFSGWDTIDKVSLRS